MCVPVSCDILYASIPYAQTHKLQDIKGLQLFEPIIMTGMRSVHIKSHFGLDFSKQQILIEYQQYLR